MGEYEMKLMDIDSEQLGIPETEYDAKVAMPASEFAKIMRDLKDLGESVRIEATSEGVKFTAEGEIGTGSVVVKPTSEGSSKASKKGKGAKPKVKAKKENDMDEDDDDEDVKPKVESDDEDEDEDNDDDEDEDEEEEEEDQSPKKKRKSSTAKKPAAKKAKKADSDESREVIIDVQSSVSLNFSIKYLNNFAKSTPLATNVVLQMSNDVPLLVEYKWEGGAIKFYLAPKSKSGRPYSRCSPSADQFIFSSLVAED